MLGAMDSSALDTFRAFRNSLYNCLHRRADALFELADALLTTEAVPSPVHLSLQPSHRRGWGSLYNALSHGRIDAQALRRLLAHQHMAKGEGSVRRTAWYDKTRPTFSDALALVRRKLWAQEATFCGSVWEEETVKVPLRFIERLTDTVCYAA